MNFLFYLLIIAGLLIFLSQTSYARIACTMYGYRDQDTIPRLRPLQKKADVIHCIHHSIHAVCGLMLIPMALDLIKPALCIPVLWISVGVLVLFTIDSLIYLFNNHKHCLCTRRDEIKRKWSKEKVLGPEHDNEVSLYRTLKELTTKNLIRNGFHALVFIILTVIELCR